MTNRLDACSSALDSLKARLDAFDSRKDASSWSKVTEIPGGKPVDERYDRILTSAGWSFLKSQAGFSGYTSVYSKGGESIETHGARTLGGGWNARPSGAWGITDRSLTDFLARRGNYKNIP